MSKGLDFQPLNFPPIPYRDFDGFSAPETFSLTAVKIIREKYARKRGVPSATQPVPEPDVPEWLQRRVPTPDATFGAETSAKQVFTRLAGAWTYWGYRCGYFASEAAARAFYENVIVMCEHQMFAPNSPQFFNTGLYWAYGIAGGPSGGYYVDPFTGQLTSADAAYIHPQLSACFIQSIQDDLVNPDGIMDLWVREARVFKHGGGSGVNYSEIRGQGEPLSGGGVSSGLMSFLEIGDRAAGAIKSGGTTRRAAKMLVLDMNHPDIEEYINCKVQAEDKVASLVAGSRVLKRAVDGIRKAIADHDGDGDRYNPADNPHLRRALKKAIADGVPQGRLMRTIAAMREGHRDEVAEYDTWWEGEAYRTVSGQNANNSVRVDNRFMRALETDEEYPLYWRTELRKASAEGRQPQPIRTVKARDLWGRLTYAAWACADPGLQFHDTINEWHTSLADGEIRASNPCSEFLFLDNSACNLGSLRLTAFYRPAERRFDVEAFKDAVRIATLALEISVLMAQYPSEAIARNSYTHRPLGLGFADLGGLLMRMGVPYDSDLGRGIAAGIAAIMHCTAYATSAEIAATVGPFPAYERNKEHMLRVIANHWRAAHQRDDYEGLTIRPYNALQHCPQYLLREARAAADDMLRLGKLYGFRNAQVTAIAPTGTIGLLMDCDTTGIEPDYALVKFKTLAGGGFLWIINSAVPAALEALGYTKDEIETMQRYLLGHGQLSDAQRQALRRAGFTEEEVAQAERALANRAAVREAFAVRGHSDGVACLKAFGFDEAFADALEAFVAGHGTLEGCPLLKPEHLSVFDCANRTSKWSTRAIAPLGHLLMMAAVQPFVSGGISKTVNLPADATITDVDEIYRQAWKLGIKAVAIYRDASKLSQPLSAGFTLDDADMDEQPEEGETPSPVTAHPRGVQEKLPPVRNAKIFKAKIGGQTVFLQTGEYPDGRLGEIFVDTSKAGSSLRSLLDCFAIAVSVGLQYGVPLEEFVEQFTMTKFEPAGLVNDSPHVKFATSIVDYIFRILAIEYLKRDEFANVKQQELVAVGEKVPALAVHGMNGHAYTGDVCPSCGSARMVRNGTCKVCLECGATTGCS